MCKDLNVKLDVDGKERFNGQTSTMIVSLAEAEIKKREDGAEGHQGNIMIHGHGPEIMQMYLEIGKEISKQIKIPESTRGLLTLALIVIFNPDGLKGGNISDIPDKEKREILGKLSKKFFGEGKDIPSEEGESK